MLLDLFSISYGGLLGQSALDLRAFVRKAASLVYDGLATFETCSLVRLRTSKSRRRTSAENGFDAPRG